MSDDFDKARDAAAHEAAKKLTEGMTCFPNGITLATRVDFTDGANWAREWCEKHMVNKLHLERLDHLGREITNCKEQAALLDECERMIEYYAGHCGDAFDGTKLVTKLKSRKVNTKEKCGKQLKPTGWSVVDG